MPWILSSTDLALDVIEEWRIAQSNSKLTNGNYSRNRISPLETVPQPVRPAVLERFSWHLELMFVRRV